MIPTALEFIQELDNKYHQYPYEFMVIEFAKLHVEAVRSLQQAKYSAGETGYITREEWEEIIKNIK